MSDERPRKRAWGKTKNRGKETSGANLVDSPTESCGEAVKRIKLSEEPAQQGLSVDLQHPERMDDATLVAVLSNIKVPIPVYSDGAPSRERLIYLFKKHVTPQPQRTFTRSRRLGRRQYGAGGNEPHRAMDIDSHDCAETSNTAASTSVRKRDLQDADPSTDSKRPATQCLSTPTPPSHATPPSSLTAPARLAKLKRSVNCGGTSETVSVKLNPHTHSSSSPRQKITWP